MDIVTDIDKLRVPCRDVLPGEDIRELVYNLVTELQKRNGLGLGLAANQLGYNLRVFVMVEDLLTRSGRLCFVNPKIIKQSRNLEAKPEKCLSLPGIIRIVKRPVRIDIQTQSMDGETIMKPYNRFYGLMARIVCHEVDHLDGKLIVDY